jgi:flagellar hook assembly protein FlgD
LVVGVVRAGRHTVTWDGRDERGLETTAGVYFYRLDGENETLTKKTIRLR